MEAMTHGTGIAARPGSNTTRPPEALADAARRWGAPIDGFSLVSEGQVATASRSGKQRDAAAAGPAPVPAEGEPVALAARDPRLEMADRDLLFALLSHCLPWTRAAAAVPLLMARYGDLAEAVAAPAAELEKVEPLGAAGAAVLKCLHTAALRLVQVPVLDRPVLGNWDRLQVYLQAAMARERIEVVRCLFLDTRNRLLRDEVLATGTANAVHVAPRSVLRRAIELDATALILVHNHPSGDATPSRDDVALTLQIKALAEGLGIALHDHLVVGRGATLSLRRLGYLGDG